MIAYFEEEAVKSYTEYLAMIDAGLIEDIPAPELAIEYYGLKSSATLSTMVMCVRADEQRHSEVNHRIAGF
jgi:ubiquinol oxidase